MKTAFVTFAYPASAIEAYAAECLASIAAQTDRDFTLIVFNDGLSTLNEVVRQSGAPATVIEASGSPATIRCQAIKHLASSGFESVVFGDIDDWFDINRVAVSKQLLATGNDIAVNELMVFDDGVPGSRPMLAGRLHEGEILTADHIRDGNCFGMSNTALRLAAIPPQALAGEDVVAFDWLFFNRLLQAKALARFTAATRTHYRRHGNNTAPLERPSDAEITRGLQIKYQHYCALHNPRGKMFATTIDRLANDSALASRYYVAARAAMPAQSFWWEAMKPIEELAL
jgi:hypothetical protein